MDRQAAVCTRLPLVAAENGVEPLRLHIVQAAKHSARGAAIASQQLTSLASNSLRVQWLLLQHYSGFLRSPEVGFLTTFLVTILAVDEK